MIQQIPLTKRRALKGLLVLAVLLGAAWAQTETVLYNFCAHGGDKCSDGSAPIGALIFDQAGNLYGTTSFGGAHGRGVAFKVTPKGEETVLYSFCTLNDCADGSFPQPGLIFDQQGNLYGTTDDEGDIFVRHCFSVDSVRIWMDGEYRTPFAASSSPA